MNSIRRHMILTALSLLAGTGLVWWVAPNTGQGVTYGQQILEALKFWRNG